MMHRNPFNMDYLVGICIYDCSRISLIRDAMVIGTSAALCPADVTGSSIPTGAVSSLNAQVTTTCIHCRCVRKRQSIILRMGAVPCGSCNAWAPNVKQCSSTDVLAMQCLERALLYLWRLTLVKHARACATPF